MPQRKPLAKGLLKELVAQIAPENRYEEIPSGPAQGKESVESQFPTFRRDSRFSS